MPKKLDLDLHILNALSEGPLSYNEIIDAIKNSLGDYGPKKQKQSFDEAFVKLLKQKKIQVYDYSIKETDKNRIQNLKPDYFIFSLIKTEQKDIRLLIIQFLDFNMGKDNESLNELNRLFRIKFDEIFSINMENWNSILRRVYSLKPTDQELLWFIANEVVTQEYRSKPYSLEFHSSDVIENVDSKIFVKMANYKEQLQKLSQDYSKLNLYKLKDSFHGVNLTSIPNSIHECFLFSMEKNAHEDLLEKYQLKKPNVLSYSEMDEIFQDVISYIISQKNDRERLIEDLSFSLTNKEKSIEKFDTLVFLATGKRLLINYHVLTYPQELFLL